MNKTKWHSKLVSLAVALALVASLVGILVLPLGARTQAELGVTVKTDKTTYCCCENVTVTATIANSSNETAVNVTADISWIPAGTLSGATTTWSGNITAYNTTDATWTLHCEGPGFTTITVDVDADNANPVSGSKNIMQLSAELQVDITDPPKGEESICERSWLVCNTYNLTFTITNTGCRDARLVTATISPDATIEVDSLGGGVPWTTPTLGTLLPGANTTYTKEMHCVAPGMGGMIHVVPNGVDNCTGRQVAAQYCHSDIIEINQYEPIEVECDAIPNPTKHCHNVTFTADITGGIPPYSWNVTWGDGNWTAGSGISVSEIHHYSNNTTEPIFFEACVTVTDECDNSDVCCENITVNPPLEVTCDAEPKVTKVCHNVTFTAQASGGVTPYSWSWDFGDGKGTSDEQNPTYHYNDSGNFTVCVNVTDKLENIEECCFNITVYPVLQVACNATPNPTKVCHNVTFTGIASGGIPEAEGCNYTWEWDFGDSGSQPGTGYSPIEAIHHYDEDGNYTATLTLSDDCLNNTATCNVTVQVNPPLTVSCNATPLETKLCHNITFTGTISGGVQPYNWIWSFGDTNSTAGTWPCDEPVVEYHYGAADNYTACFNVTDKLDNNEICCVNVTVHPPLEVECDVDPEVSPVCHNVTFTATREGGIPGNPYSWLWVFGDGFTSTSQNVSRAYMCVGNYTATVTLTDTDLGNTANCTANVTVTIFPPELISPILNAQLTSKNVTFEWEDIGCCNYTLEVWQKEESGQKVLLVNTGKDNTWTGPIFNGAWRWQVTATDSCNVSATSDTWFFRVDQPSTAVTVMSPNGGEVWQSGDSHAITWTAVPTDGVIDIYYSSDNGASWTLIKSGEVNDGAYPWAVPTLDSAQCLVRVVVTDAATGTAQDTSDGVFTITTDLTDPTVTVTSPNGGESYAGGSTQNITWTASDNVAVTSIDLYFSSNGGAEWAIIATGEANDGTYSWTVPGVESDQCLVKVEASDAAGNVGSDTSDAVFSITITEETPPSVTVKTPNGGETWAGGSRQSITWKASDYWPTGGFAASADSDLTINIYYKYGGGAWMVIAAGEVNDGEYKWDVPEINDAQCLVRVDAVDAAGNVGSDTSDDEFTIITGVVVSIPDTAVSANTSVVVPININGVTDLASVDIWLSYDKDVVTVANVTAGTLGAITVSIDNTNGVTKINRLSATGNTGDFIFANVGLQAVGSAGEFSALDLDVKEMVDSNGDPIAHSVEDGVFTILALMEGDVTLNSHVTIGDAMFIAQWVFALRTLSADQLECADTYDDGVVAIGDAMHIAQWLVDPDGTLLVLTVPLWEPGGDHDDHMLVPVP